jgi:phosphoribosylanthranilate isomerase
MSLWIKICANTSLADAELAVAAGADAVGFVFAPSPRRVTADQVREIAPRLPSTVEKIGVFVDSPIDAIVDIVRNCGLTGVQLHAGMDLKLPAQLRAEFGLGLRILHVLHYGPEAQEQAAALAQDRSIDAVLVDSKTALAVGGTGVAFDWEAARKTLFVPGAQKRLIAAGGLNPQNVARAIATLTPWGVDVASGVEAVPGKKDGAKVLAFVTNARAASPKPDR